MRSRLAWGALALAGAGGHVVYPAFLVLAARRRDTTTPDDPSPWPGLSIIIPAYREAGVIGEKVCQLQRHEYPGPLEVIVVADDDSDTAAAAAAAGATVLSSPSRRGKAQAINAGVAATRHDFVVLTDANNELLPGSLQALARWFTDPAVAAVAGEKVEGDAGGEQLYWRFESWLKKREAALGTTIGLVGELAALRVSFWEPIPAGVGTDDLWIALDTAGRGGVVAYEPTARAIEPPAETLKAQWERRTRSVSGAMNVFRHRRWQLGPSGGLVAVEIWGHRLWRYTFGPLAHTIVLVGAGRRARRSRFARGVLAAHLAAAAAVPLQARGRPVPLPLRASGHALFLQAVALGGLVRYLRGERGIVWPTISR